MGTAFLLADGGVTAAATVLEEAVRPHAAYRKPLKLLADMLMQAGEAEEKGGQRRGGGGGGGSSIVVLYSLPDDCWDVLPLTYQGVGGKKGGKGKAGGPRR